MKVAIGNVVTPIQSLPDAVTHRLKERGIEPQTAEVLPPLDNGQVNDWSTEVYGGTTGARPEAR